MHDQTWQIDLPEAWRSLRTTAYYVNFQIFGAYDMYYLQLICTHVEEGKWGDQGYDKPHQQNNADKGGTGKKKPDAGQENR